jgi:hypothetical protein
MSREESRRSSVVRANPGGDFYSAASKESHALGENDVIGFSIHYMWS